PADRHLGRAQPRHRVGDARGQCLRLRGAVVDAGVGRPVTALEQLGRFVAQCGREPASAEVRELVELHIIDTVAAWIASTQTDEGIDLLYFREVMRKEARIGSLALDLSTRCALARLSEIDDIHLPSMITPGGIVIPGALTLAAADPLARAE